MSDPRIILAGRIMQGLLDLYVLCAFAAAGLALWIAVESRRPPDGVQLVRWQ